MAISKTKAQFVTSIAEMINALRFVYESHMMNEIPKEKPRLKAHIKKYTVILLDEIDKLDEPKV